MFDMYVYYIIVLMPILVNGDYKVAGRVVVKAEGNIDFYFLTIS